MTSIKIFLTSMRNPLKGHALFCEDETSASDAVNLMRRERPMDRAFKQRLRLERIIDIGFVDAMHICTHCARIMLLCFIAYARDVRVFRS